MGRISNKYLSLFGKISKIKRKALVTGSQLGEVFILK